MTTTEQADAALCTDTTLCIVGLSAVTAIGYSAAMTVAAVRAQLSQIQAHPFMINSAAEPYKVTMLPILADKLDIKQRLHIITAETIQQGLTPLVPFTHAQPLAIDVLIGLPTPRPGLPETIELDALQTVNALAGKHFKLSVYTACKGYVSGAYALQSASKRLQNASSEFCLTCGIDSYLDAQTLTWLDASRQLYTQENAWGLIPGEAGGSCLICTLDTAHRYQLPVLATLIKVAISAEPDSNNNTQVCTGRGLSLAVSQALAALPENAKVNHLLCDLNGQTYRSDELGFMLARHGHRIEAVGAMLTPADCWGDVGAATTPLLIALACYQGQRAGGGIHLVLSSSGPITSDLASDVPEPKKGERGAILLNTAIH